MITLIRCINMPQQGKYTISPVIRDMLSYVKLDLFDLFILVPCGAYGCYGRSISYCFAQSSSFRVENRAAMVVLHLILFWTVLFASLQILSMFSSTFILVLLQLSKGLFLCLCKFQSNASLVKLFWVFSRCELNPLPCMPFFLSNVISNLWESYPMNSFFFAILHRAYYMDIQ